MPNNGQFSLTIPLLKAWQDGEGGLRFEGVAASTSLDRQAERLTPAAVEKMQQYSGIDLLPSHNAGVLQELGIVEKCWVDNNQFRVAGYLEPGNPEAARLYERLKAGKQYGLSIGGRVLKAHWDFDTEAGRQVKHIDDVVLDHIAVCRPTQAANPDTYLTALAKAAEAVIDEPSEQISDEAIFTRLGKTIVEACQKIWPFGSEDDADAIEQPPSRSEGLAEGSATGPQSSEDDPAQDDPAAVLLDRLQKQIDSLSEAVDRLCKDLEAERPEARRSGFQPDDSEAQVSGLEPDTDSSRRSGFQPDISEEITPGRPQAIPGQIKSTSNEQVTWKGVL